MGVGRTFVPAAIAAIAAVGGSAIGPVVSFADSPTVSFGRAGNTVTASAAGGGGLTRATMFATGNTTQATSGTQALSSLIFQGAGIASVGITNGSVVVSVPAGAPSPVNFSAGTTSNNLGSVVFSNSNNFSFGLNGSTITGSGGVVFSAGTQSSNLTAVTFGDGNGVTFGLDAGLITVSYSQSAQVFSAGNGSYTFQTLKFLDSNGVSFSTSTNGGDGSYVFASHNGLTSQSNQAVSAGTAGSFTFQTLSFSNANGITIGTSAGPVVTFSHNGLTSQSNQAFSAAGGSSAFQTLSFSDNALVSFTNNAGQLAVTEVRASLFAASNTTQGTSGTQNIDAITFAGAGGVSVGVTGGSVVISGATGGGGGGGPTVSQLEPWHHFNMVSNFHGQATWHFHHVIAPEVHFDQFGAYIQWSNSSNSTGSATLTQWVAFYTRSVSTLSLLMSTSTTLGLTYSGTVGNWTNQGGNRNFTIGWTSTLTQGEYWVGYAFRSTTAGANNASVQQILGNLPAVGFSGPLGAASNATRQRYLGQGYYTASSTSAPASLVFSEINGTFATAQRPPIWFLLSQSA